MADFEEMRNAVQRATQDDIVTRLREGEKWHKNGYIEVPSGFYDFLANEIERERKQAADEIERLRAQIKFLKGTENFEPCSRVDPCEMCKEIIQKGEA